MLSIKSVLIFTAAALAARPFLNEPDTGIELALGDLQQGDLAPLEDIVGLADFDWAARKYLNASSYTYYRNGAAGEWTYRNNLEVFQRVTTRPRILRNVGNVASTLETTFLGRNVSSPFYISACARGGLAHEDAELALVRGASNGSIMYMISGFSTTPRDELAAARTEEQTLWQQIYFTTNITETQETVAQVEELGMDALVLTVDSAGPGTRQRAQRFNAGSADEEYLPFDWDFYHTLRNLTSLPIVVKGVQTVEDAKLAVQHGVEAIVLSNHGGRNLDGSPSSLEVAYEIHQEAPEVFQQLEVYADGGVRYGTDVLKLLSLGVRGVGLGRPFMYSLIYGNQGPEKVTDILNFEIASDASHLGIADVNEIGPEYFSWEPKWGVSA